MKRAEGVMRQQGQTSRRRLMFDACIGLVLDRSYVVLTGHCTNRVSVCCVS